MLKYKKLNKNLIDFEYYIEDTYVVIKYIRVKYAYRNKGIARKELENFISWVWHNKKVLDVNLIILWCCPQDNKTKLSRLRKFYESFGFVNYDDDYHLELNRRDE